MFGPVLVLCLLAAAAPEAPPAAAVLTGPRGAGLSVGEDGATAYLGRERLPQVEGTAVLDTVGLAVAQARAYFMAAAGDPNVELLDAGEDAGPRGIVVQLVQARGGVPIEGTFASAQVRDGTVRFARYRLVAPPDIITHAAVSAAAATAVALGSDPGAGLQPVGAATLAIAYFGGEAHLCWRVTAVASLEPSAFYVDARSGGFLGRRSLRTDVVVGRVLGKVNPACGDDALVEVPLPYVQYSPPADAGTGATTGATTTGTTMTGTTTAGTTTAGTTTGASTTGTTTSGTATGGTGTAGSTGGGTAAATTGSSVGAGTTAGYAPTRFADAVGTFSSATITAANVTLFSPYLRMVDLVSGIGVQAAPAALHPLPSTNNLHLEGFPQVPLDAYRSFHTMRHWFLARSGLSDAQMRWGLGSVDMNLELPQHCNAFYETLGNSLNFFSAGGNPNQPVCVDTGTVPFVVHHEYGHGIAYHSGNTHTFDLSIAEGLADSASMLSLDISAFTSITVGCSASATDARTCDNAFTYCASGCTYTAGSTTDPHQMGQVLCGVWNEIRRGLVARYGDDAGRAVAFQLYLQHLATLSGTMPDTYQSAIAADADDDETPANGTRHSCEINEAFATARAGGTAHFPGLRGHLVPSAPSLAIAHAPPGVLVPASGPLALHFALTPHPVCDPHPALAATLYYQVDGETGVRAVPLTQDSQDTTWTATLAEVTAPATLRYWLIAQLDGASFSYPFAGPDAPLAGPASVPEHVQTLRWAADEAAVYEDDFEADSNATVRGSDAVDMRSAWEWGPAAGLGGDPLSAHSGQSLFGTHLAAGGEDLAMRGVTSTLDLPPVAVAQGTEVTRLQFWQVRLNPSVTRVEVNGQAVYSRPAVSTGVLRDWDWRFEDIDIAAAAAVAEPVRVRFVAQQDAADPLVVGAWNLDDVRVVGRSVGQVGRSRYASVSTRSCLDAGGGGGAGVAILAFARAWRRRRGGRTRFGRGRGGLGWRSWLFGCAWRRGRG